jgi:hypothetical protein
MRMPWDQFAKEIIPTVLAGVARVSTSEEVKPDAQWVDVVVEPEPGVDFEAQFARLGWFAKMAAHPALFEPFSTTPQLDSLRDCVRKQLNYHHQLRLQHREALLPHLWVLSAGEARQVTTELGLAPRASWPPGFRLAPPGWGIGLVVLSELPPDRATLPLRLLGRGPTLGRAIREVSELPADDPMRSGLVGVLVRHSFVALESVHSAEEQVMLEEEFQKFTQQIRDEARREVREEEREHARKEVREEERAPLRQLVHRLLEDTYGDLDSTAVAHLAAADSARLSVIVDRVVKAQSANPRPSLAAILGD